MKIRSLKVVPPLLSLTILRFCGCSDDDSNTSFSRDTFSGVVVFSPFQLEAALTIGGLTNALVRTGQLYSTDILDNQGSFRFTNLLLPSPFIELSVGEKKRRRS